MPQPISATPAPDREAQVDLTITTAIIGLLCLCRVIFCAAAPDVLSGPDGLGLDVMMMIMAVPFVLGAVGAIALGRDMRLTMLLLLPGLILLGGTASMRTQFILFHFGRQARLIDGDLAAWDAAIGFDWSAYFDWLIAHPHLHRVLTLAYQSIWLQPPILSAYFIWRRRVGDYGRLQIALPLSFVLVCVIATILPALGAYQFHGMTPDRHPGVALAFSDGMTAPMTWLRQEVLPVAMPDFPDMRVITFPSWHAAAAVIFFLAAWSTPYLRWASLALNLSMLAATPVQGSHFLSDLVFGAALGGLSFAAATHALAAAGWVFASGRLAVRDRCGSIGTGGLAPLGTACRPEA